MSECSLIIRQVVSFESHSPHKAALSDSGMDQISSPAP
jgi:hypothetical protein